MAEYINREEMLKYIDEHTKQDEWLVNKYNADWIYNFIDSRPTADVVPKSEVVLASSDAVKMLIECHGYALTHDADIKKEVAREIFAEIESKKMFLKDCVGNMGVVVLFKDISELKKKYTEEKK